MVVALKIYNFETRRIYRETIGKFTILGKASEHHLGSRRVHEVVGVSVCSFSDSHTPNPWTIIVTRVRCRAGAFVLLVLDVVKTYSRWLILLGIHCGLRVSMISLRRNSNTTMKQGKQFS